MVRNHVEINKQMKGKMLTVIAGVALTCVPAMLNAQEFLSPDSLRLLKIKGEPYVKAQNNSYFVMGQCLKGDMSVYSGFKMEGFKPVKWTLSPLIGGKVLYCDEKKVRLFDPYTEEEGKVLFKTEKKNQIWSLAYSPDGTFVLVFTMDNKVNKCVTDEKVKDKTKYSVQLAGTPTKVQINKASNVALMLEGDNVEVFNLERGTSRKVLNYGQPVLDIDFSDDYREFAVLLADGTLKVVDIADLKEKKSYPAISGAKNCIFHPQGKYVIVNAGKSFELVNLLTSKVDYLISVDGSDLLNLDLFSDSFGKDNLLYIKPGTVGVYPLSNIERYHAKDLKMQLGLELTEWAKMQPGESEADYRARVNDETRAQKALQLENDLVTAMAGNLIANDGAKLGNYVETNQALAVNFDNMPSIYLNIPSAELNDLNNINDLEFINTVYGLDANDNFEVIYTEARNKKTGKVYMYDNRNREKLVYDESSFVPMEVIQLANVEAAKLETMKEEVVEEAKTQSLLTDHTHITVNTEVEQDVDADGNKILNYNVSYMYQVEEEFSARDDFKAGKYVATESNAAVQMLNIIDNSIKGDFAKYMGDSKKLVVSITGSADATPIIGKLRYNSEYGDIENQLAAQDGELTNMTITKAAGIKSNEQLALIRAIGVSDYLAKTTFANANMPIEYKYNVEVSKEKGSEFRRIKVALKFVDTFKEQMKK